MRKLLLPGLALLAAGALLFLAPSTPADSAQQPEAEAPTNAEEAEAAPPTSEETFVPSEKLPADSAISFPVDI